MRNITFIKNIFLTMLLAFAFAVFAPGYAHAQSLDVEPYSGPESGVIGWFGADNSFGITNPWWDNFKPGTPEEEVKEVKEDLGHGILADATVGNIFAVNIMVSQRVSDFLVLGNALHCFAWNAGRHAFHPGGYDVLTFPRLNLLIVGLGFMLLGLILVIVIGYYLVDISFKLGFAVMAMPIAIALWPFPKINDRLGKVVSIMFNSAGILIFLSLGVAYLWALFEAVFDMIVVDGETNFSSSKKGLALIYQYVDEDKPEPLDETFRLFSINVLLLIFAGLYGFQLVGKLITDYTEKFFPDSAGTGGADGSPMHHQLTKATSFATNLAKKPINYARDVAKTQTKRVLAKGYGALGKKVSGWGATSFGKGFFGAVGGSMTKRADDFEKHYQSLKNPKSKGE